MASFGHYEIVDELYRTPFGCVCSARLIGKAASTGGRASEFVVKLYEPAQSDGQAAADEVGAAAFLGRASLQQKLTSGDTCHWAKIHDMGIAGGKPFYASDYYPRTAQKLIAGKVRLSPTALNEIISSVIRGLRELERVCGRAHGSLKPSNVLIGGAGEVSGARIVLSDPAAVSGNGQPDRADDLLALGSLLYLLVMQRPYRQAAWPIESSEEWSRLGRSADQYRSICSGLLNSDPAQRPDYASLEKSLAGLMPRRLPVRKLASLPFAAARRLPVRKLASLPFVAARTLPVRKIGAVAVVLAVGLGGAAISVHFIESRALDGIHRDRKLWLDSLLQDRATMRRYESLAGPLADQAELDLITNTDDSLTIASLSPPRLRQIRATQAAVTDIRGKLFHVYDKSVDRLRTLQLGYAQEGFVQPAEYLAGLIAAPLPDDSHVVEAIDAKLRLADWLESQRRPPLTKLAAALAPLETSSSPDLKAFAVALRGAVPAASILTPAGWEMRPNLEEIARNVANVSGWPDKFDRDLLLREQPTLHLDKPGLPDVQLWLVKASGYHIVDKPELMDAAELQLTERLKKVDDEVRQQLKWIYYKNPASTERQNYEQQKREVETQIAAVRTKRFAENDFARGVEAEKARVASAIDGLRLKNVPPPPSIDQLLADWRQTTFSYPIIQNFWNRHIDDLKLTTDNLDPVAIKQTQAVKAALQSLDCLDFEVPAPLAKTPFESIALQKRDQLLATLLPLVDTSGSLPDVAFDQAKQAYRAWSGQVMKLAKDFPITPTDRILDEAFLKIIDDKWSGKTDKDFWDTEVQHEPLLHILKPDLDRLNQLRQVIALKQKPTGASELVRTATDTQARPELVLAAWGILSGLNLPAPKTVEELQHKASLIANVQNAVKLLPADVAKQRQLELKQAATDGWLSVVHHASTEQTLVDLRQLKQSMGIGDPPGLSVAENFNFALCEARDAAQQNDAAAEKQAVQKVIASSQSLDTADQNSVQGLINNLVQGKNGDLLAKSPSGYLWPDGATLRKDSYARSIKEKTEQEEAARRSRLLAATDALNRGNPDAAKKALDGLQTSDAVALTKTIDGLVADKNKNLQLGERLWQENKLSEAFAPFENAAKAGSPRAMLHLGGMYENGQGVGKDLTAAKTWLTRAATLRDPLAMVELAGISQSEHDRPQAVKWFTDAAREASAEKPADLDAIQLLALKYLDRDQSWAEVSPSDVEPAFKTAAQLAIERQDVNRADLLLRATDIADPRMSDPIIAQLMTELARQYKTLGNVKYERSWYERAASRNNVDALAWLNNNPQNLTPIQHTPPETVKSVSQPPKIKVKPF